jgi:hypothetical protein
MERRLAAAYERLRAQDDNRAAIAAPASEQFDSGTFGLPDEPVPLLETRGLNDIEGPYPQFGIGRVFRWQVAKRSTYVFETAGEGSGLFEFEFSNLEHGQVIQVFAGDELLGEAQPPESGWDHEWHIAFPLSFARGQTEVTIEAPLGGTISADSNPRHIALFGVSLKPLR